jgi:hypothetical protein
MRALIVPSESPIARLGVACCTGQEVYRRRGGIQELVKAGQEWRKEKMALLGSWR